MHDCLHFVGHRVITCLPGCHNIHSIYWARGSHGYHDWDQIWCFRQDFCSKSLQNGEKYEKLHNWCWVNNMSYHGNSIRGDKLFGWKYWEVCYIDQDVDGSDNDYWADQGNGKISEEEIHKIEFHLFSSLLTATSKSKYTIPFRILHFTS